MNDNHKLALYVSYYLTRFDKVAYTNFKFWKSNTDPSKNNRITICQI